MKITGILTASLCAGLVLVSCAEEDNPPAETETTTNVQADGLTAETIDGLLDRYFLYEKYVCHSTESMQRDTSRMDEDYYCPVTDENYDTWAEWTAFVEGIFCGTALEEATVKMNQSYKEVDGMTYVRGGAMGWYLSAEPTSVTIEEESDTEAMLIVARYEMFEQADVPINYILHKTENGWRIADIENSLHYDLP